MKIILTPTEAEEIFHSALCNAVSTGYMSGYGISLTYDRSQYKDCREHLERVNPDTQHCWEDVLMQILKDGGKLTFEDHENDGEYTRSITMKDVHENINQTPAQTLLNFVNEHDDAGDADLILQTVFYNEILFG